MTPQPTIPTFTGPPAPPRASAPQPRGPGRPSRPARRGATRPRRRPQPEGSARSRSLPRPRKFFYVDEGAPPGAPPEEGHGTPPRRPGPPEVELDEELVSRQQLF